MDTFLSIVSFVISVSSFVWAITGKSKKWVTYAVIFATLMATCGALSYRFYENNQLIRRTQAEITEKLSDNMWTFDKIYEELPINYKSFAVVSEALFRAVESKVIGDKIIDFRSTDGSMQIVRVYYNRKGTRE